MIKNVRTKKNFFGRSDTLISLKDTLKNWVVPDNPVGIEMWSLFLLTDWLNSPAKAFNVEEWKKRETNWKENWRL